MGNLYNGVYTLASGYTVSSQMPIDDRIVVNSKQDLIDNFFNDIPYYTGILIYIVDEQEFYVFTATDENIEELRNYEEYEIENPIELFESYWQPIGKSVGAGNTVVTSIDNLTDGSIETLEIGSSAYVNNTEDNTTNGLYVLTGEDATDINNWTKVTGDFVEQYIGIDTAPLSGSGISVTRTGDASRVYISASSPIQSDVFYTSLGLNTYDENPGDYDYDYIELFNGSDSGITLYNSQSPYWIKINIVDDSLGLNVNDIKIKNVMGEVSDYENNTPIEKGALVCFGKDIDFTGFDEKRANDNSTYIFGTTGSTYENVDIFKETSILDVMAHHNGETVKLLTETDKDDIEDKIYSVEDKIENIYTTLQIDPDGDGSEESATLQEVIVNMNNAITKLEQLESIDPERITENDIAKLFPTEEETVTTEPPTEEEPVTEPPIDGDNDIISD